MRPPVQPTGTPAQRQSVVVVGGGFAGLNLIQHLRDAPVNIVLVDRCNHHLFQPLLYQVATAALAPAEIAEPTRSSSATHAGSMKLSAWNPRADKFYCARAAALPILSRAGDRCRIRLLRSRYLDRGIGWVLELIEIAGGEDVFPELRKQKAAKDRIVSPHDVIAAAPDVILASWCGTKVVPDKIRQRPGWGAIPAVRNDRIVEIK